MRSIDIDAIACSADKTRATIFGTARVNGQGSYDFRIDVQDLGEPGKSSTPIACASRRATTRASTKLRGGNVQVH